MTFGCRNFSVCGFVLCAVVCFQPLVLIADDAGNTFFEQHVRPLLINECWDCHGEDVQESGLRMDSLQALLRGGERGPALKPGEASKSLMILAVNHGEPELQMPEGDKLTRAEIQVLEKWVDMGAPWPNSPDVLLSDDESDSTHSNELFTDDQRSFWAFQTPVRPELPSVAQTNWPKNEIDYFILHQLEYIQ